MGYLYRSFTPWRVFLSLLLLALPCDLLILRRSFALRCLTFLPISPTPSPFFPSASLPNKAAPSIHGVESRRPSAPRLLVRFVCTKLCALDRN